MMVSISILDRSFPSCFLSWSRARHTWRSVIEAIHEASPKGRIENPVRKQPMKEYISNLISKTAVASNDIRMQLVALPSSRFIRHAMHSWASLQSSQLNLPHLRHLCTDVKVLQVLHCNASEPRIFPRRRNSWSSFITSASMFAINGPRSE